jgi:hypothetical protein
MKQRSLSLLISLLIHCLLVFIFTFFPHKHIPENDQVRLLFEIDDNHRQPVPDPRYHESTNTPEQIPKPPSEQTFPHRTIDLPSWASVVKREKKKAEVFFSKPSRTLQTEAPVLLWNDVKYDPRTMPKYDPVAELIRKQEMGTESLMFAPVIEPVMKKKIPVQFDFIPSEAQVRSLQQLYEKGKASQVELYPNLTLSEPVTAEDYNKSLDMLVQKGFISRKKISPENILYVMGVPVELSSRNRRNPVFLYTANVTKNKTITFIQAKLQQLKEKQAVSLPDSMKLRKKIEELKLMIQILTHQ